LTTTIAEDERDRLYAMAREAQLRDIKPLAVKPEKSELEGVKTKRARAEPRQPKKKAVKKQTTSTPMPEPEPEPVPEPESEAESVD